MQVRDIVLGLRGKKRHSSLAAVVACPLIRSKSLIEIIETNAADRSSVQGAGDREFIASTAIHRERFAMTLDSIFIPAPRQQNLSFAATVQRLWQLSFHVAGNESRRVGKPFRLS